MTDSFESSKQSAEVKTISPKSAASATNQIEQLFSKNELVLGLPSIVMMIGTWFGVLFIFGFLGMFGVFNYFWSTTVLGIILLVASVLISKTNKENSIFLTQIVFIFSLLGQLCVLRMFFSYEMHKLYNNNLIFLLNFALQLVLFALIENKFHRFLIVFLLPWNILLFFIINDFDSAILFTGLLCSFLTGILTYLWTKESKMLIKLKKMFLPLSYGLVASNFSFLVFYSLLSGSNEHSFMLSKASSAVFILPTFCITCAFLYFFRQAVIQLKRKWQTQHYLIALAIVLLGITTFQTPGVLFSFLILFLAHFRKEIWLKNLARLFLGVFLVIFYYQLETTLLIKSVLVFASGLILLLLYLGLHYFWEKEIPGPDKNSLKKLSDQTVIKTTIAVSIFLCILGTMVWQKQNVLANGQTMLLELTPVDPRSIMQGDYMILNYTILQEVNPTPRPLDSTPTNPIEDENRPNNRATTTTKKSFPKNIINNANGLAILSLDENKVASFVEFDTQNRELKDKEIKVKYKVRNEANNRVWLAPESFLFSEGKADYYQQAKYAELKVSDSGEVVISSLVDKDFNQLNNP